MRNEQCVTSVEDRFWSKVDMLGDCWEWRASTTTTGYGQISSGGTMRRAHRVSYELSHGPIPDGLLVRHKCDNRICVRPDHLELGTYSDNNWDRALRGGHPNSNKTHCKWGHEFTPENTRPQVDGKWRTCVACSHRRAREQRERARANV